MKKKAVKSIIAIVAILALFSIGGDSIYVSAKDSNISIYASEGKDEPIFSNNDDGFWSPGEDLTKEFFIENISSVSELSLKNLDFSINYLYDHINNYPVNNDSKEYKEILKSINISVTDENGSLLYQDNLNKLKKKGFSFKESINLKPGQIKKLFMRISISSDLDNIGQGVEADINIGVNYSILDNIDKDNNSNDIDKDSNDNSEIDNNDSLPYTGGISSSLIIGLGIITIGSGMYILKRNSK